MFHCSSSHTIKTKSFFLLCSMKQHTTLSFIVQPCGMKWTLMETHMSSWGFVLWKLSWWSICLSPNSFRLSIETEEQRFVSYSWRVQRQRGPRVRKRPDGMKDLQSLWIILYFHELWGRPVAWRLAVKICDCKEMFWFWLYVLPFLFFIWVHVQFGD